MDRRRSSHIVPEIYEATIDNNHWDYVLTMIAKLTKSKSACLYYKNKEMDLASTIAQYGMPAEAAFDMRNQCDRLDSMFCSKNAGASEENLSCTQFSPGSNGVLPVNAEIYQNWMKPRGLFHVGGAQFIDSDTHKAGIAILRDEQSGEWNEGELRVIDEILPHLKRALNIHSEFTHLKIKQDALLQGLDRLVIGLILYDAKSRPVYINPTAMAVIESHPALRLENGDLKIANAKENANLRETIEATINIDPDDSWKQSVAIGVTHKDATAPLPILVTPMHAHLVTADLDYEGARVAVFLSDPDLKQPISVESLISVYGMTPAEAQVSIALANGHSIDEIASRSHHSTHTIRSQLKSVFKKTGVSRQSELIKLLLTGSFAQRRRSVNS